MSESHVFVAIGTFHSELVDVWADLLSRGDLNRTQRLCLSCCCVCSIQIGWPQQGVWSNEGIRCLCKCERGRKILTTTATGFFSPTSRLDRGVRCEVFSFFFWVLGLQEMSAIHTGGRWQEVERRKEGREEDRMQMGKSAALESRRRAQPHTYYTPTEARV